MCYLFQISKAQRLLGRIEEREIFAQEPGLNLSTCFWYLSLARCVSASARSGIYFRSKEDLDWTDNKVVQFQWVLVSQSNYVRKNNILYVECIKQIK